MCGDAIEWLAAVMLHPRHGPHANRTVNCHTPWLVTYYVLDKTHILQNEQLHFGPFHDFIVSLNILAETEYFISLSIKFHSVAPSYLILCLPYLTVWYFGILASVIYLILYSEHVIEIIRVHSIYTFIHFGSNQT